MKLYIVKREERNWDDDETEILDNVAFASKEAAIEAAEKDLEAYIKFYSITGKRLSDSTREDKARGSWYASTHGHSLWLEIQELELTDRK